MWKVKGNRWLAEDFLGNKILKKGEDIACCLECNTLNLILNPIINEESKSDSEAEKVIFNLETLIFYLIKMKWLNISAKVLDINFDLIIGLPTIRN